MKVPSSQTYPYITSLKSKSSSLCQGPYYKLIASNLAKTIGSTIDPTQKHWLRIGKGIAESTVRIYIFENLYDQQIGETMF